MIILPLVFSQTLQLKQKQKDLKSFHYPNGFLNKIYSNIPSKSLIRWSDERPEKKTNLSIVPCILANYNSSKKTLIDSDSKRWASLEKN